MKSADWCTDGVRAFVIHIAVPFDQEDKKRVAMLLWMGNGFCFTSLYDFCTSSIAREGVVSFGDVPATSNASLPVLCKYETQQYKSRYIETWVWYFFPRTEQCRRWATMRALRGADATMALIDKLQEWANQDDPTRSYAWSEIYDKMFPGD